MRTLPKRAHNALYRCRSVGNLIISTPRRTIYYDINNPDILLIAPVKILVREYNFGMQSELR